MYSSLLLPYRMLSRVMLPRVTLPSRRTTVMSARPVNINTIAKRGWYGGGYAAASVGDGGGYLCKATPSSQSFVTIDGGDLVNLNCISRISRAGNEICLYPNGAECSGFSWKVTCESEENASDRYRMLCRNVCSRRV